MEETQLIVDSISEMDETAVRVSTVDDLCDESIEACDQLTDIAEVISDTSKQPSDATVKMAEIAVEAICARLGFAATTKVSFESLEVSVETVVSKIKEIGNKIWESLVKAFKWLVDKIEHIVAVITKNRDFLLKRLKDQQKSLDEIADNIDVADKKLNGSMVNNFSLNGKTNAETAKTIMNSTGKLFVVVKKGNEVVASYVSKFKDHKERTFNIHPQQDDGLDANLIGDIIGMLDFIGQTHQHGADTDPSFDKFYGNLLGGTQVRLHRGTYAGIRVSIMKTAKTQSSEAQVLNKTEMHELLSSSVKLVEELKKFDSILGDLKKQSRECASYCFRRFTGGGYMAKSINDPKSDKAISVALQILNNLISRLTLDMPVTVFKTASAAGQYVDASLRFHKPAKQVTQGETDNRTYSQPLLSAA